MTVSAYISMVGWALALVAGGVLLLMLLRLRRAIRPTYDYIPATTGGKTPRRAAGQSVPSRGYEIYLDGHGGDPIYRGQSAFEAKREAELLILAGAYDRLRIYGPNSEWLYEAVLVAVGRVAWYAASTTDHRIQVAT